jgi:glutathione synthase/RimK-type ligase-like ATP-grasp enzyme
MIIIATVANDLHAQLVKALIDQDGHSCHILELDRVSQHDALTYGIAYPTIDRVCDSEGTAISVSKASVLWLRRIPFEQHLQWPMDDGYTRRLVDNDCRGAALGLLRTHFKGDWVSSIEATQRASDKIWQLYVAAKCGFRVPRTVVTQSPSDVNRLCETCGSIVVKTVVGASGPMLQTVQMTDPSAFSVDEYQAAPAIYQEYIDGSRHIRLVCFGDHSYAGMIETSDVDWRGNLNVPVEPYDVKQDLHVRVRSVLDRLGLEMGVIDIKLTTDDEPVWLEVNPQGQFAFLDGLAGTNLLKMFANYLVSKCGDS